MNANLRALRGALKNYRTRRAAIEQAVTEGKGIVETAKRCFAMTHNLARSTCHPEDLGRAILTLAREGDKVEALFTRADRH